jgi:hypothetical protein
MKSANIKDECEPVPDRNRCSPEESPDFLPKPRLVNNAHLIGLSHAPGKLARTQRIFRDFRDRDYDSVGWLIVDSGAHRNYHHRPETFVYRGSGKNDNRSAAELLGPFGMLLRNGHPINIALFDIHCAKKRVRAPCLASNRLKDNHLPHPTELVKLRARVARCGGQPIA